MEAKVDEKHTFHRTVQQISTKYNLRGYESSYKSRLVDSQSTSDDVGVRTPGYDLCNQMSAR